MSMDLVFKDRRFRSLFWTQFSGALNDNYFKNALVILITYKSIEVWGLSSKDLVALSAGIFMLPFFLFSATAGQIADKYQKADIIRMTKISELVIMCLATLAFFTESYAWLIFILFLMGGQSAFFGPLKYGIIPQLLKKEELVSGNAYVSTGTMVAILLGTILGGQVIGNLWILTAGLILFALMGIFFSRGVKNVPVLSPDIKVDFTLFRPSVNILKLTLSDKKVFRAIMGMSWFWFVGAGVLTLIPSLAKDIFFVDKLVANFFLGTFTIGVGIGAILTEKISAGRVEIGIVPIAAFGMSLFMIDLFYVSANWPIPVSDTLMPLSSFFEMPGAWRMTFDLLMISICGGLFSVPQLSFVQKEGKPDKLAQIIAGTNIWNACFMVTSSVMILVLYAIGLSIPQVMLVYGILNMIASFVIFFWFSEFTWRFWMVVIAKLLYNFEAKGKENIPENGPFVISCNHVSFVDWVFIMATFPQPVRFLIDHSFYKTGWAHFWFSQCGLIPIATRKESQEVLDRAWAGVENALKQGDVLGIFPEGWISRDGKLRKFQPGITKISGMGPAPVVPIIVKGLWGSFFSFSGKGLCKKWPGFRRKVQLKVYPAIPYENFDYKELEKLYHDEIPAYEET